LGSVIAQTCEAAQINQAKMRKEIRTIEMSVATILDDARLLEIDEELLAPLVKAIGNVRSQLERL
jgi:hypothetical protein